MKIAVTIASDSEFDRVVCFKSEGGALRERQEVVRLPGASEVFARQLVNLEVDILLAGRVTAELRQALDEAGVALISGLSGPPERTAAAYLDGTLDY